MDINLTLTLEEVNGIIGVMSTLPFNQVNALMNKIRSQAVGQVQAAQAAQQPAPAEVDVPVEVDVPTAE